LALTEIAGGLSALKAEAVASVRDAIQIYVAALQADGLPVPVEKFEAVLVAV
jgi:predicted RNase H-like HicB family nuclease